MSWHFSQALVAAYSAATCLDGEQSAPLNGSPTQLAYLSPDRMTAFSRLSRFGMTFKPLTENLGRDVLTSYLAAFPAKTSAQPEKAPASKEPDRECGSIWPESLAKYDPATSLWKTAQCSLLEDSIEFSETWPRWGLMQDGVSYQQQTLVRHTKETGSGSWLMPTPTTNPEAPNHGSNSKGPHNLKEVALTGWKPGMMWPTPRAQEPSRTTKGYGRGLKELIEGRQQIERWPTPTASAMPCEGTQRIMRRKWLEGQLTLEEASAIAGRDVRKAQGKVPPWPTPTSRDWRSGKASQATHDKNSRPLSERIGGSLNPTWVEWLMGWPLGWTDLKRLEMDKYRSWQQQHGIY